MLAATAPLGRDGLTTAERKERRAALAVRCPRASCEGRPALSASPARPDWSPPHAAEPAKPARPCNVRTGALHEERLERARSIAALRKMLKPGATVNVVLRHVSKSGMVRDLSFFAARNGTPITFDVARALG